MSVRNGQTAENNQSLLGAIRQKEATITRNLAAARDAAEKEVEAAKKEARQLVDQATEEGRRQGEAALKAALEEIEIEAAEIESQAGKEAASLNDLDEETMKTAVNQIINIITGRNQ